MFVRFERDEGAIAPFFVVINPLARRVRSRGLARQKIVPLRRAFKYNVCLFFNRHVDLRLTGPSIYLLASLQISMLIEKQAFIVRVVMCLPSSAMVVARTCAVRGQSPSSAFKCNGAVSQIVVNV